MEKETHEGVINLVLNCDDSNDTIYGSGKFIEPELLKKHNLQPGDRVLYKVTDGEVEVIAKVITKKTIEKMQ